MAVFKDPCSDLPQTIDIGGDIYFLGPEKSIDLAFKSREQFLKAFVENKENTEKRETECLLRKYMYYSVKGKKNLVFDSPEDKEKLIKILRNRANNLKESEKFTSSILKNTIIKRSYLNILKIIQELEGSSDNKKTQYDLLKFMNIDILPCTKAKKYIKDIDDARKFQLVLEMAWYLLHPDEATSKLGCQWAKLIKQLDTLRPADIATEISKNDTGIEPNKSAFNYFKKINLQTVAKSETIKNALDQAKKFAADIQDTNATNEVKNRLELLLKILEMKKYLDKEDNTNKSIKNIERSMIINPMKGGGAALNKPLGMAMKPLFDYFKVVYDPIYTFLEESIKKYRANNKNKIIIPQLTSLLHICNNIKPSDTNTSGGHTYGVYRIINVNSELLQFINGMINETSNYISPLTDINKNTFNKQLFRLPKVRLSSLSNISNSTDKDYNNLYIQFFTMGANINLMSKSILKEDTDNAIKEFYKEGNIYIVCTKSDNITEQIPINVHDIDYNKVDVSEDVKIDNIPENYFNKNKDALSEIKLENLLDIKPYVVYNDTELALSIFIALKELMPIIE